ncbi:cupin [Silvibacterium acidisoli]|uniref:cupin n=1 Tax=Acidobacteriaceae bacterium ZG23-2 TaxID=2883246 RepID=UPI00406D0933
MSSSSAVYAAVPPIPGASLREDVQIFEYSKAANPIESGATPRIPIKVFGAELYAEGETRAVPLNLQEDLRVPYPATGPGLLASFLHINKGEKLATSPNAGSEFYFVIRGKGRSETAEGAISWKAGDFLVLPGLEAIHFAEEDTAFYVVNDSPLFAYLGARRSESRFAPTLYTRESVMAELEAAKNDPEASTRSRVSVLLANKRFAQTMTITHTLWTMFGIITPGTRQLPHRHQSVALDFVVSAQPGVYTLVGEELGENGLIKDPVRVDWVTGTAFVTPPGYWHEHVNESGADAYVMPIQDAGLHTYLRTLDIQFYKED